MITYKVVSQVESREPDASGAYVRGVRVTAVIDGGPAFSVFVPNDHYSAANVKAALDERAAIVGAVADLGGS